VIKFLAEASQVILFLLGIFLMIVILLQRGRGGGLAGAFGGMGGQSAFGTKAGDVFTRITIVLAICWVILAGGSGYLLRAANEGHRAQQDLPSEKDLKQDQDGADASGSGGRSVDPPTTPISEPGSTTPSPTPDSSSTSDPAPATTDPSESTTPSPTEN
jgi:preprotein translocase subunit SecG